MNINQILKVTPRTGLQKGHFLARYYEHFPLNLLFRNLLALSPIMHNERYTEVYFQTESGNVYKIWKNADSWFIADKNGKTMYKMLQSEMLYAFLRKGERFYFGKSGYSTAIVSIIAVDRSIARIGISESQEAQMVAYYESALKGRGIINKF